MSINLQNFVENAEIICNKIGRLLGKRTPQVAYQVNAKGLSSCLSTSYQIR